MTSLGHARAFASGSLTDFSPAFAKGNVSIPHDQQALVNEVSINGHSESIVRDGVWSMIPGGAHLANLKKGDIIFSASQTEALLKNGSIPGHARAYASGTVDDVGDIDLSNAFAGGMHGNFAGGAAGRKLGSSNKKTNTTPTSSGGSGNSGGGNGGGGGGNNSSTTSKQKHAEQVFDWVARTLTKFKDTVENISNRINDYVSSAFKKTMLNRQEKAIVEEINANKHGAQSYTNKANSIASGYTYYYTPEGSDTEQKMNIVIPDSYKKAVQGGYWNIEDMDTTTDFGKGLAEAIQKYQDYYDKAKDCTQEAQNLYNEQLKVFEQWANMPTEDAGKKIDTLTNKVNGLKSAISSLSTGKSGLASIAISGAGENYSDMMAGIDYILNNIGGITSGQYFTSQDKSNMKKSNSFDTGYNSGHLKGYANGTKHVGSNRIAMTNENGREIIVTKDGWITPLEASDMVIPNDITETLIDMAERQQNYAMNGNFKMPELKVKDASGNSVNNVYNTFTVQGDLTRDTLPELNKILDLASSKTQNDM